MNDKMSDKFAAAVAIVFTATVQPSQTRSGTLEPTPPFSALDDEILNLVRDHFFDADVAKDWATKNKDFANGISGAAEFSREANRRLAELKTSHTAFYTVDDPGHCELRAIFAEPLNLSKVECESIGADVAEDGRVRRVFGRGPVDEAKIVRGDRLLHADGSPFHPVRSIRGKSGQKLTLRLDRGPEHSQEVTVEVRSLDPRKEWLAAQKTDGRIIVRDGRGVGYVPIFSCAGEEHVEALRESFTRDFGEVEALIVDLRDGWGGCNPEFVSLFSKAPAELWFFDREKHCTNMDHQWRKPAAFLINGRTRSGKEIVAHSVKKHGLGKLVGEQTAGAVLGGRVFLLSDGSILYLAVADVRADGERLEGVGVKPDVEADDAPNYLGHDPQFDTAVDLLFAELSKTKPQAPPCPTGHHHRH